MPRALKGYHVPTWQYRKAEEGEHGGVIINFAPTGKVEIHEGLIRHEEIDEDTAEETAENPAAPKRLKASYSAPLRRYIAHHKTLAVQELLLANPRKAKEVTAVVLVESNSRGAHTAQVKAWSCARQSAKPIHENAAAPVVHVSQAGGTATPRIPT